MTDARCQAFQDFPYSFEGKTLLSNYLEKFKKSKDFDLLVAKKVAYTFVEDFNFCEE